jgi:hypothetical protein
VTYKDSKAFN